MLLRRGFPSTKCTYNLSKHALLAVTSACSVSADPTCISLKTKLVLATLHDHRLLINTTKSPPGWRGVLLEMHISYQESHGFLAIALDSHPSQFCTRRYASGLFLQRPCIYIIDSKETTNSLFGRGATAAQYKRQNLYIVTFGNKTLFFTFCTSLHIILRRCCLLVSRLTGRLLGLMRKNNC